MVVLINNIEYVIGEFKNDLPADFSNFACCFEFRTQDHEAEDCLIMHDVIDQFQRWGMENIPGRFMLSRMAIYFDNEDDALMFKLAML